MELVNVRQFRKLKYLPTFASHATTEADDAAAVDLFNCFLADAATAAFVYLSVCSV